MSLPVAGGAGSFYYLILEHGLCLAGPCYKLLHSVLLNLEKIYFLIQTWLSLSAYTQLCTNFYLNFNSLQFLGQLRQEEVIYLKRKPHNVPIENCFETGRISVMRGSRRVLMKVVLFQIRGCSHLQDDARPNFFLMTYHLLQKFFGMVVEIKQMSFLFGKCLV